MRSALHFGKHKNTDQRVSHHFFRPRNYGFIAVCVYLLSGLLEQHCAFLRRSPASTVIPVRLQAGNNTIEFGSNGYGPDLDRIAIALP